MLAAGLLFLLTSGPSLNDLLYTGMYLAYMIIGAHYEEARLLRLFGDAYRRYQDEVGAFVPRPARIAPSLSCHAHDHLRLVLQSLGVLGSVSARRADSRSDASD